MHPAGQQLLGKSLWMKINIKSSWMVMLAFALTYLLQPTHTHASILHSHTGSHCNHVHPKPEDVSKALMFNKHSPAPTFPFAICYFVLVTRKY